MSAHENRSLLVSSSPVLFFRDRPLGLVVLSDCGNLGPHFVRLVHENHVFTTDYLLGGDESVCHDVRFLAPLLLETSDTCESSLTPHPRKELLVSMSLRNRSREALQEIARQLLPSP